MRHLRVPSAETQDWLALCRTSNWLLTTSGVVRLEGNYRGIPLAEHAPTEADVCWNGHSHIEVEGKGKGPMHWMEEEEFGPMHGCRGGGKEGKGHEMDEEDFGPFLHRSFSGSKQQHYHQLRLDCCRVSCCDFLNNIAQASGPREAA